MPIRTRQSKLEHYMELQQKTARNITRNAEHWRDFLITAANLYKYSFPDQLLMYAQRPEATACAEIELWNKRMNRYIAKGAKGIALIDHSSDNPRLHYVFDISDTVPSRYRSSRSRVPQRWMVTEENTKAVTEQINERFGIRSMNFTEAIPMIAEEIVKDNLDEYIRELMLSCKDSFLEDLDEANITKSFRDTAVNSIAFSIFTRCGYDAEEYISLQDLSGICDYNTIYTLAAIGTAVSDMSEAILRQIERSVKEYDLQIRKELQHGQQHTEPERRTADTGQVRADAKTVPTESQEDIIQSADTDRTTERASERDTADGREAGEPNNGEPVEAVTAAVEVGRDSVDKAHEHNTGDSGRSSDERTDTQLTYYDVDNQNRDIPYFHNNEYINEIIKTTPYLRATKDDIVSYFHSHYKNTERSEYIRSIFNNDFTELTVGKFDERVGYKTYENGLLFWQGSYLNRTAQVFHDWWSVAQRYETMITLGEFLDEPSRGTQISLFDEPEDDEQPKDIINQAAIDAALRKGSGFEHGKHRIYERYENHTPISETIAFLKKEYGTGGSNYVMEGSGINEWHDAKGIKLTRGENELLISWNTAAMRIGELISQDRYFTPEEREFHKLYSIREKAVEEFLKTGGYYKNSIMNICIEFSKGGSTYENANFLRKEFNGVNKGLNIDGVNIAFSCDDSFIRCAVGNSAYGKDKICDFVSWESAAARIKVMLDEGRFAPQETLDNMHSFELKRASHSFWFMHQDVNFDSYPELKDIFDAAWFEGGFPDSTERIAKLLDDPAERADLIYTATVLSERYAEDKNVMRFRLYEPDRVLKLLSDLNLEREQFTSERYENTAEQFVTQDEITVQLVGRDAYNQTKIETYLFFKEYTDSRERADYLKELFGTGGSDNRTGLYISYDKKGVSFARQDAIPVVISWRDMAERIGRLIADNRYMTERQLAEDIPKYQRMQEERQIHNERVQYVENSVKLPAEERQKDIAKRLYYFIETIDLSDRNKFEQFGLSDMTGSSEEYISEVVTDASKREALMSCLERIQMSTTDVYARNNAHHFREELSLIPQREQETVQEYLPWYQEYSNIKAEYESKIVFYRVGDFYEMFGDDAVHAAEVLQLTMTGRDNGVERVPMCGIPVHAAEDYINRLVSHGLGVAVADMDGKSHRVARVITADSEEITKPEIEITDRDIFKRYAAKLIPMVTADAAYINARTNSDEENIRIECDNAVNRAVKSIPIEDDERFYRLYYDNVNFQKYMQDYVFKITYTDVVRNAERALNRRPQRNRTAEPTIEIENNTEPENTSEAETDNDTADEEPEEEQPEPEQTTDAEAVEDAVIAVGMELTVEGRRFEIEGIRDDEVSLIDKTFAGSAGFPISRIEPIGRVIQWVQNQTDISKAAEQNIVQPVSQNFRITDYSLGIGGDKTKFKRNIDAIRTLKTIEEEKRYATPEEQEILSQYVGWGGLAAAFDERNNSWSNEYTQLKNILTEEEYSAARASTLSSFYTSPTIINAMYTALSNMGFKSGNILEPSCGVGNFFGMLPDEMTGSKLYGVEIDSITGRIATLLYPDADIKVQGFEKTEMPDNFYDVVIGNVPFGDFKVVDSRYNKYNFNIHDYFIAKSIDKVRAGGIVAVVVSKGFMDKSNPSVRKYVAQRADLLGAIRLPNNAFKDNAGTEVISDILFFQKRDRMVEIEPEWVFVNRNEDDLPINGYFAEHPEMVMGELKMGINKLYGKEELICTPIEGADLSELLSAAVENISGDIPEITLDDISEPADTERVSIPASPDVKNYSYTLVDGDIYYRVNSLMDKVELPAATTERVKGMIAIRDCTRKLMELQLEEYGDDAVKEQQTELNRLYDTFTAKYGLINSLGNRRAFREDADYYLLSALEVIDDDGKLERKADMFTKRTIKQRQSVTKVDTAVEALAVSIGERASVDLEYMQELTGFAEDKIISDLHGVIYANPETVDENGRYTYESADEYLSGNIRHKLRYAELAAKEDPALEANVTALKAVMPKDLEAGEIDVRLGATWINPSYIQEFMYELFETPYRCKRDMKLNYSPHTGEWFISKKNYDYNNVLANVTYGTSRMNAYQILEQTLNLRDVKIYDTILDADGREKRVPNEKETTLAREKQTLIQSKFRDWIFRDYDRRTDLVATYNERFNSIRPREYDGSHLVFNGMTPEIHLRKHQLDAIAHTIYGGNTLLAHEVGAGKTFEMIASAMEAKRLGLCNKSLFVVPNHLTEQMGADVLRLYPSANVLVATSKDFSKDKRRKMCAKIATGDFDIIVIGHSQLEKIPISAERQEQFIQKQIDEVVDGIADLKSSNAESFQVKQLERTKKNLEARLEKLTESVKRDDLVTFEELGVDRLYVDEAHYFKNAYFYTKMQNVAGLSQTEAQKSADLMMKCRYMDELTGGRGLIFATGTPVSNSMVEVYTMMKYLQDHTLTEMGWQHFDSWASNFGETVTQNELAPEGKGYRSRTRFARFYNLPELMATFKECADIKTADVLNLPVPKAHYHNVVAEPTEMQKMMVDALSERAKRIHDKQVTPDEDNMLCITNDGRKIGLDARLMNPMAADEPQTKVNLCVDNVFKIWNDTSDKRSTQLIFCDFSTPKPDGSFNLYDDIRDKLVARGVPKEEIVFIHEAKTEPQKKDLFAKLRKGTVRIMIGSTSKCGAGVNVQDKLIALHDLDAPWRPADLQQRSGRIVRQGNENPEVDIFRYVTNGTFDSYLWQTLENKQRFISQIMTSKSPVRSCEDADEATLSYAEVKALCAGDPRIKEKMDLDIEVAKLKVLKASHVNTEYALQDSIHKGFPKRIADMKGIVEKYAKDAAFIEAQKPPEGAFAPMTIMGHEYTKKEDAGKALLTACSLMKIGESHSIGKYMGFDMSVKYDSYRNTFYLTLKRNQEYTAELGKDELGNIVRINNALRTCSARLSDCRAQLENLEIQLENAKKEVGKPFPQEAELQEKTARLAELEKLLALDSANEQTMQKQEPEPKREVYVTQPPVKKEIVAAHGVIQMPSAPVQQPTAVYADNTIRKSNVCPKEQFPTQRKSLLGRIDMHKAVLAQRSGKQIAKERNKEL